MASKNDGVLFTVAEDPDMCSGFEVIRRPGSELYCIHPLNGNSEWEAVYATAAMLRELRDQLNKLEL